MYPFIAKDIQKYKKKQKEQAKAYNNLKPFKQTPRNRGEEPDRKKTYKSMPNDKYISNKNHGPTRVNNQNLINTNKLMYEQPNQVVPIFDQNFQKNISKELRLSKGEVEVENEKVDFSSGNTVLPMSILESNYKARQIFYRHSSKFAIKFKYGKKIQYI